MTKVLDLNKPVQTRDGRKVRILATDRKGAHYPVLGLLTQADDEETVESWTLAGEFYSGDTDEADLVNVPEKRVLYFNIYPPTSPVYRSAGSYTANKTRAEADRNAATQDRIACIRVEFEAGRFDD